MSYTPSDDEGLREKITRLRRERDAHQMDESDYVDSVMALISQKIIEARRTTKEENVRDFSAVVEAFNRALVAGFDAPSVRALRMVINGADARANYIDLPKQDTKENL